MSNYPVRIKDWFTGKDKETAKFILKYTECETCGRRMSKYWKTGYAHHAITVGYGNAWCTKRCLEKEG